MTDMIKAYAEQEHEVPEHDIEMENGSSIDFVQSEEPETMKGTYYGMPVE